MRCEQKRGTSKFRAIRRRKPREQNANLKFFELENTKNISKKGSACGCRKQYVFKISPVTKQFVKQLVTNQL